MAAARLHLNASIEISKEQREIIRNVITSGGVLVFPTDTIYGLGCDAFNEKPVRKIYELKGRSFDMPFSVHLGTIDEIGLYAKLNGRQHAIIKKLLPGPYTLLLACTKDAPAPCVGSEGKIGIRVPKSKIFSQIYQVANQPLAGTSANLSGETFLTEVDSIIGSFGDIIDLIVTTDEPMSNQSSTVVDLTENPPKTLRGQLPDLQLL